MNWKDIRPREDILRPVVKFIGGPKRMGAATALTMFPLFYWLSKRVATRNMVPDPGRRAAIVSGVLSPLLGYGAYWLTKNRLGGDYPRNGTEFADLLLGRKGSDTWGAKPQDIQTAREKPDVAWNYRPDYSVLTASDWADYLNEPVSKGSLYQGIDELDATPVQKDFLNSGIKFAPGNTSTTLWGLGDGFGQAVDTYTNSALAHTTRAIEGAIIGGAFGSILGLSPNSRKWAMGIGAVADSLKGSQFYNALGQLG